MRLAWNAIVKNESARIARCVNSLLPHIDCAIVLDTGSTDGTPELVEQLFAAAGKPVEIYHGPFVDFAQARNLALGKARMSELRWDYLLLADADMEFVVSNAEWRHQLNGGLAYDMQQTVGELVYWNRRVVSQYTDGIYKCPTHEYLDVPAAGAVAGAYFIDHADGSNRPDKFDRDIAILEVALQTETDAGLIQRMTFYLAQSYFDKRDFAKAAELYKKRVELGGWDEEVWNAQVHYAACLESLGDLPGYIWNTLQAYAMRSSRAEPLYDLAKWFRERGQNHLSLLFSQAAMELPLSADQLFVNHFAHTTGPREEYSICAFYDVGRRDRGARVTDNLALGNDTPWPAKEQARRNQFWYLEPLSKLVPSFMARQIEFNPPDGYKAMNPSIASAGGMLHVLVRTVNYEIDAAGRYVIHGTHGDGSAAGDRPINTCNFIVGLSPDLVVHASTEIELPSRMPSPAWDLVRGFEDSRLFRWKNELWTLSTVREQNPEGWCEQVLAPLEFRPGLLRYGNGWEKILVEPRQHEKNWMPWVHEGELRFVYRLGTVLDQWGKIIAQHPVDFDVSSISGGSQVIPVRGMYLALVHEARQRPDTARRYYQHRFVQIDGSGRVLRITRPFVFHDREIEFAAGMVCLGGHLVVSYGRRDAEAWLATMNIDEVLGLLD